MTATGHDSPTARLRAWGGGGTTTADTLSFYDSLAPASIQACIGRWRGSGIATGHPLDGLLEALGWYGKDFVDPETAHPLLFETAGGEPVALDPIPLLVETILRRPSLMHSGVSRAAFRAARPLLRTRKPRARLRRMEHRGVVTATMIYDGLPILDHFRAIDLDTLLGLMDLRGMAQPFFFVLRRVA